MERDYLKAYAVFDNQIVKLAPKIEKLIRESTEDIEGQLHALMALSACKLEDATSRGHIYRNITEKLNSESLTGVRT